MPFLQGTRAVRANQPEMVIQMSTLRNISGHHQEFHSFDGGHLNFNNNWCPFRSSSVLGDQSHHVCAYAPNDSLCAGFLCNGGLSAKTPFRRAWFRLVEESVPQDLKGPDQAANSWLVE
jgi:hypothetical protein